MMTTFLAQTVLPFLLIMAGASDFLTYRIPNWLTAATALAFLPMAFMTGMGGEAILWHIAAGLLLLAIGFALFAGGIFGGGDAKLMAAAGLWFGWAQLMPFLVYTALAGGLLAIAVGVWSLFHVEIEIREVSWAKRWLEVKPDVPYGVAFAIGGILAYPGTWWMSLPS
jgi:prepilin peptidase CpaA